MMHTEATEPGSYAVVSALEKLDLSPQGLADAPASLQDPDSIVSIGIPD